MQHTQHSSRQTPIPDSADAPAQHRHLPPERTGARLFRHRSMARACSATECGEYLCGQGHTVGCIFLGMLQ